MSIDLEASHWPPPSIHSSDQDRCPPTGPCSHPLPFPFLIPPVPCPGHSVSVNKASGLKSRPVGGSCLHSKCTHSNMYSTFPTTEHALLLLTLVAILYVYRSVVRRRSEDVHRLLTAVRLPNGPWCNANADLPFRSEPSLAMSPVGGGGMSCSPLRERQPRCTPGGHPSAGLYSRSRQPSSILTL